MKILCLTMEFAPQIFGGLGTHVVGLVKKLCDQGHTVDVVTYIAEQYKNSINWGFPEYNKLRVFPVSMPVYSGVYWIDQTYSNAFVMAKVLNLGLFDYDVIHCHSWIFFSVAIELRRRYNIPIVTTLHRIEAFREEIYKRAVNHKFVCELDKWVCDQSDAVICVSNDMKKQVHIISSRVNGVYVIPNGITVKDVDFQKKDDTKDINKETRLLFVGRLEPEKGLNILLNALSQVNKDKYNIKLTVIGDGSESHLLHDNYYGFQIHSLGKLAPNAVLKTYCNHDIFVIPSLSEPFGIVAIEALAAGLPVIASRVGGLCDIIVDPRLGYLVESGNPDSLKACICKVIDENTYKKYALFRREYVTQNYSWDSIVLNTVAVYKSVQNN